MNNDDKALNDITRPVGEVIDKGKKKIKKHFYIINREFLRVVYTILETELGDHDDYLFFDKSK